MPNHDRLPIRIRQHQPHHPLVPNAQAWKIADATIHLINRQHALRHARIHRIRNRNAATIIAPKLVQLNQLVHHLPRRDPVCRHIALQEQAVAVLRDAPPTLGPVRADDVLALVEAEVVAAGEEALVAGGDHGAAEEGDGRLPSHLVLLRFAVQGAFAVDAGYRVVAGPVGAITIPMEG